MSLKARLPLFPVTASVVPGPAGGELAIDGLSLAALADEFGTPLYVYDQATMDRDVDEYRRSLAAHYAGAPGITLAGKAFLCVAAAQWAQEQGLRLDCTGGELRIAAAAGQIAPPSWCTASTRVTLTWLQPCARRASSWSTT